MIQVSRTRHFDAPASKIFALLSDTNHLSLLLPRVRQIEVLERNPTSARIATYMAFGPLGDIRSEGDVHWQTDREIIFKATQPAIIEARWTLNPANNGTGVMSQVLLDLTPMLGPVAKFVPPNQVIDMVGPRLDATLDELGRLLAKAQ